MPTGKVVSICIATVAGEPMKLVDSVEAISGEGLRGDRYASGSGSYNKDKQGNRQVTLINNLFLNESDFSHAESRRNIAVEKIELMRLIGRDFQIGEAIFHGVKYCDPCKRPSKLAGRSADFQKQFFDRGGLIAEVIKGGKISSGDVVTFFSKKG